MSRRSSPVPRGTDAITVATDGEGVRVRTQDVAEYGHRYRAFVVVPLDGLAAQHAEMVRAMFLGGGDRAVDCRALAAG